MAKRNSERVREISYTTGTGPIVLARPVIGYRTLAEAGCVDGDTADLTVEGVSSVGTPTGEWEVGTYTWGTGGVLMRTTITASSNGNAPVNWANGTRWVHGRSSGTVDEAGNSAPTAPVQVTGSRNLASTDNGLVLECTATATLTVPAGLPAGFRCVVIPFGTTSVAFTGTTGNGAGTTITRAAASNAVFGITQRGSSATSYVVDGV